MWSLQRDGDIAILTVDGFAGGDGGRDDTWTPFVRDTFQSLRRDRVQRLIVDLRQNEGGSDEAAFLLLRQLLRTRLSMPQVSTSVSYQTVPSDLRPYLTTWDDSFFDRTRTTKPRADGRFDLTERGPKIRALDPARDAFAGELVLLIGPVNSSASHTFARLLKGLPHVMLVGRETGGSLRASTGGNIFFMRLPATGFEVDIPLIAYEWPGETRDGGVKPDTDCAEERAIECAKQQFASQ
jgi:C-terminal processing protease CtpA/Prc